MERKATSGKASAGTFLSADSAAPNTGVTSEDVSATNIEHLLILFFIQFNVVEHPISISVLQTGGSVRKNKGPAGGDI